MSLVRLGAAVRTSLASAVTGKGAASASLAIVGMIVGVGALVVLFGTGDGDAHPGERRRTIALVVFAIAGFVLAAGIFLAAL